MVLMHNYPVTGYLAQSNGQAEIEAAPFAVLSLLRALHQRSYKRNVRTSNYVHALNIKRDRVRL